MRIITLALGLLLSLSFTTQAKEVSPAVAASKTVDVILETNMGKIELELNQELAPISVANFIQYVETGFYNNTIFHRVINNFMVQGGGFKIKDGKFDKQKTNPPVKNESVNTPPNKRGTIAMARTSDPDSATAQFFINVTDNAGLNYPNNGGGYATFGKVTKGQDVVNAIRGGDTIKSIKNSYKGIAKGILILAKDFSDRDEYNAYKHALRIYPSMQKLIFADHKTLKERISFDLSNSMYTLLQCLSCLYNYQWFV